MLIHIGLSIDYDYCLFHNQWFRFKFSKRRKNTRFLFTCLYKKVHHFLSYIHTHIRLYCVWRFLSIKKMNGLFWIKVPLWLPRTIIHGINPFLHIIYIFHKSPVVYSSISCCVSTIYAHIIDPAGGTQKLHELPSIEWRTYVS